MNLIKKLFQAKILVDFEKLYAVQHVTLLLIRFSLAKVVHWGTISADSVTICKNVKKKMKSVRLSTCQMAI